MARILIRPDDLARLAQRLDAAAEDFARVRRKLGRARDEVAFNRADEGFPGLRFFERSQLVDSNLRRLADESAVDAALLAQTVEDVEFDGNSGWTKGLLGQAGAPTVGDSPVGSSVGSWAATAAGLTELGAGSDEGTEANHRLDPGGLFVAAHVSDGDALSLLDRVAARLGSTPPASSESGGTVWARLVSELFTDDGS